MPATDYRPASSGSENGPGDFETAGVAGLRRGSQMSENAAPGRKMTAVRGHYWDIHRGSTNTNCGNSTSSAITTMMGTRKGSMARTTFSKGILVMPTST